MLGVGQVANVEDVRGRMAIGGLPSAIDLVQLVVKKQEGHVGRRDPSLVGVASADVGRLGDLERALLVRDIDDRQRVFVVVEADLTVGVFLVGASVDDALRWRERLLVCDISPFCSRAMLTIMDVAILVRASGGRGILRVRHIHHPQPTRTGEVSARADSIDHFRLFMRDNVV